jgi:hypothetical protein
MTTRASSSPDTPNVSGQLPLVIDISKRLLGSDENIVEKPPRRSYWTGNAQSGLTVLCLAWSALNTALLFFSGGGSSGSQVVGRDTVLRRPSQYIGLDDVYRNVTGVVPPPPIVNHPTILAQISSTHKDKVFPDDSHRVLTPIGLISPEDRHFLVDHDASRLSCSIVRLLPY